MYSLIISFLFCREYMERVNIQPHPNHTLSFNQNRTWIFAPELSQGNSLADNITSLNIPVIMAQENTRGKYWDSFMLDSTFSMIDATLFVNKTVGELLFEGYEDTLLAIAEMAGATADSNVPMDRFGWFYAVSVYYHRTDEKFFIQLTSLYSSEIKLLGEMENSACTQEKITPLKSVRFPVGTIKPALIMKDIVGKFVDQPVAFSLPTSKVTLWNCFPMRLVPPSASNLTIKLKPSMVSMVPSLNYQ